ncbi:MAG TPA: YetF domain-containing protein [Alphaproteobacteria bacterium]|nr:YetF domain-containing protein [Alphaproteobacteria bacterium]
MTLFHHIFGSDATTITWWQMCARAAVMTVYAVVLYRLSARRAFGRNTALDIVVAVVLGSTLSRGITGNAGFIPVILATAVLVAMHWLLTDLALKSKVFSKLTEGSATKLIDDGEINWENARRTNLSADDLNEALRLSGVEDPRAIKAAYLERNGRISVIHK